MWHQLFMALSQNPWHRMDFIQRGMTLTLQRQSSRILIPHLSSSFSSFWISPKPVFEKTTMWESTAPECLENQNSQSSSAVLSLWHVSMFRSEALNPWFISNQATTDKTPRQFSAWVITANLLQMLNRWNLYMTSLSINTSTLSYFNCWCNNTVLLLLKGRYMNLGVWLFVFSVQQKIWCVHLQITHDTCQLVPLHSNI